MLDGNCTFNVLVYADADSEVPLEWGDSDAKEIKNGERVQLRSFSTNNHRVDTLVSYRYGLFLAMIELHLTEAWQASRVKVAGTQRRGAAVRCLGGSRRFWSSWRQWR